MSHIESFDNMPSLSRNPKPSQAFLGILSIFPYFIILGTILSF